MLRRSKDRRDEIGEALADARACLDDQVLVVLESCGNCTGHFDLLGALLEASQLAGNQAARGKDFLNLFCYTGAASIHAAMGGARSTTSVDMSNTYLAWLRKNLAHNGLDETRNLLVRANCLQWLEQADRHYDLILLDRVVEADSR